MSVWIAVHRPVRVDDQVILHRQESASVVPDSLVEKMDAATRASCIKISDEDARRMFPDLYASAKPVAQPASPEIAATSGGK